MNLGYPYYYSNECTDDSTYLSDHVISSFTSNSQIFFIGFIVGMSSLRAFAEDGVVVDALQDPGVIPAPAPVGGVVPGPNGMGGAMGGRMRMGNQNMRMGNQNMQMGMGMLNRKQIAARVAAVSAACGSAVKCLPDLTEKAIEKGSENPKTVAVIGCIFVAGWCAGQVFDHFIMDRLK